MLLDARKLPDGHLIEADICIVGAGVAGLILAREMDGQGLSIALLESGGFDNDPEAQSLAAGENAGIPFSTLEEMRVRRVGGTSHAWIHPLGPGDHRQGLRLRPLDELDFETRAAVPHSGWPFPKSHLEPYYRRAEAIFQIRSEAWGHDRSFGDSAHTATCLETGTLVETIYKVGPRDPFTTEYPDRLCRSRSTTLVVNATVLEVETTENARTVTSLRIGTHGHREMRARARAYVLAVGGIEVPRILLLSNRYSPAGLGNEHDLVGRFFMDHPHFGMGWLIPADRAAARMASIYRKQDRNGERIHPHLALAPEVLRREQLLNLAFTLTPAYPKRRRPTAANAETEMTTSGLAKRSLPAHLARHSGHIVADLGSMAGFMLTRLKRRVELAFGPPKAFRINHMAEQTPNPISRVELSRVRDGFGQNRARLTWRLQATDLDNVERTHRLLDAEWRRLGIGRLDPDADGPIVPEDVKGGYHHMGTARMHQDPARGVVNEDCRLHGVSNLFVASSAVFPTGGCANPTLTIGALAIRLADHLSTRLPRT
jgi:choline dehydrogenase-like flavoprotein